MSPFAGLTGTLNNPASNAATLDLLFAIVAGFLLLVVLLQAALNRRVWWVYLWSLPVVLVAWVLVR